MSLGTYEQIIPILNISQNTFICKSKKYSNEDCEETNVDAAIDNNARETSWNFPTEIRNGVNYIRGPVKISQRGNTWSWFVRKEWDPKIIYVSYAAVNGEASDEKFATAENSNLSCTGKEINFRCGCQFGNVNIELIENEKRNLQDYRSGKLCEQEEEGWTFLDQEIAKVSTLSHNFIDKGFLILSGRNNGSSSESSYETLSLRTFGNTNDDFEQWMGRFSRFIGHLRLGQLCLVQTHNSGTYKMNSPVAKPWASTQDKSLMQQMKLGIRVLDIRLGCDKNQKWILVHDKWRTRVSLKSALKEVCKFVRNNPTEIIILDFHRFVPLEHSFDWKKLFDFILEATGELLIANRGFVPTLSEIWQTTGRILIAWNSNESEVPKQFFKGVHQGWYRNASTVNELHDAIEADLQHRRVLPKLLWTVGACLPATVFTPVKAIPEVDKWFIPGNDWMRKVNIIQVDFVVSKNKSLYDFIFYLSIITNHKIFGMKRKNLI